MDEILQSLRGITSEENILVNEPLKNHTTFKVGGPADILVTPTTKEELIECLKLNIPKFVMGNGSNLIVKDKGIRGLVIKTTKVNNITLDGNIIEAEVGAYLGKISIFARENSLTGFEFASGIPGTVGGGVSMNAGAYGGEMKDVVIETTYCDLEGNIYTLNNEEHEFGKRKSFFTGKDFVVLSTKIKLNEGNKEEIASKMEELKISRNTKQPVTMPSAGSIFKRPEGHFAGKLIEDSGLKGYTIGGAQVSTLHAGFIVNIGNATAKDILDLIKYIQEIVIKNYGVELETEVKVVGED